MRFLLKKQTPEKSSPVFDNSWPFCRSTRRYHHGDAGWRCRWTFPILECTQQDGADEGERHADGKHIQLHGKVHAVLLAVQSGKSIRKLAPSEAVNVLRRKRFPRAGSENDPGNLINLLNLNDIFYSHLQ